jgi:hypothetical protein
VVFMHHNLRLIHRQREERLKGKTKMWDVFPDDMGLNNSVELALSNLDLNELVLENITFDDGDPFGRSSSTSTNAQIALNIGKRRRRMEEKAVVVMPILMIMTWRTTDSHDS